MSMSMSMSRERESSSGLGGAWPNPGTHCVYGSIGGHQQRAFADGSQRRTLGPGTGNPGQGTSLYVRMSRRVAMDGLRKD